MCASKSGVDLPFSWRAVGTALAASVLKLDGNLLGSGRRGACGVGGSQTSAKKDMAEATFAKLPLDLVLGRSSDLDRVGERRRVGVVVVVSGRGVVGADSAAIGHPVAPVVVGAHGPLVFWLLYSSSGEPGSESGLGFGQDVGIRRWREVAGGHGGGDPTQSRRNIVESMEWAYEPYLLSVDAANRSIRSTIRIGLRSSSNILKIVGGAIRIGDS